MVTFAEGTTAVFESDEGADDIMEDSNVVGEWVRTRLQFKFNRAVIVNSVGWKRKEIGDMINVGGRDTLLLENWKREPGEI